VLNGCLAQLQAAGTQLVSVDRARPSLEEVFIRLIRSGGDEKEPAA
jgi:hypothetical protein